MRPVHVPDDVHRTLKSRGALAGKSLSDWVLDELERLARLPSEEELLEHLRRAEPFVMKQSSSTLLRKDRDAASSRQLLDAALVTTDERQSHTPRLGIEVIVP